VVLIVADYLAIRGGSLHKRSASSPASKHQSFYLYEPRIERTWRIETASPSADESNLQQWMQAAPG
jgi:hypothetical protein